MTALKRKSNQVHSQQEVRILIQLQRIMSGLGWWVLPYWGAQTPGRGDKTPAVDPTVGPIPAPDVKPEEDSKTDPRLQSFWIGLANFQSLKKADASFESYQESVSADQSSKKETNNSQSKGEDDGDEKARSAYSRGIIDLLKSGYKSAMQLKEKYEEYQAVKEEKEASPNKIREFKAAFESSISGTTQALSLINGYQKGADNLVQAAIPFLLRCSWSCFAYKSDSGPH